MASLDGAVPFDGRGFFVTLEGGEGVGKSTQVKRLAERLRTEGWDVVSTREPGGSSRAEAIRRLLLEGQARPYGIEAEAMLFAAARMDHVRSTIRPALARGAAVICDRFTDSSRVYQGTVGGVPEAFLDRLERLAVGETRPDLTVILDLPAELGLTRARVRAPGASADRYESEALAFHRRVRQAYLAVATADPRRCALVSAEASVETVADRLWTLVEKAVGRRRAR